MKPCFPQRNIAARIIHLSQHPRVEELLTYRHSLELSPFVSLNSHSQESGCRHRNRLSTVSSPQRKPPLPSLPSPSSAVSSCRMPVKVWYQPLGLGPPTDKAQVPASVYFYEPNKAAAIVFAAAFAVVALLHLWQSMSVLIRC